MYLIPLLLVLPARQALPVGGDTAGTQNDIKRISGFVASIEPIGRPYAFDHDGDGDIDMAVQLVKTRAPDLTTDYVTLQEALAGGSLVLRENPQNYLRAKGAFAAGTSVVAQRSGGRPAYYQGGTMLTGGGQNRGFGQSGFIGSGVRGQGSGTRGYGTRSARRGMGRVGLGQNGAGARTVAAVSPGGVVLDALCFEKGRNIRESMRAGSSERFSYAGMASPSVRQKLVLSSRQVKIDRAIAAELRRLRVSSRTRALSDALDGRSAEATVSYCTDRSREVLPKSQDATGMVVTDGKGRILCADFYASPALFKKMSAQLIQSAALEVCPQARRTRGRSTATDADALLRSLSDPEGWTCRSPGTYRLISPGVVAQTMIRPGGDGGTTIVHLEAYPR